MSGRLIRVEDAQGERHYLNLDHVVEVAVRRTGAAGPAARIILAVRERGGEQRAIVAEGETAAALLDWLDALATALPRPPPAPRDRGRARDVAGEAPPSRGKP